MKNNKIKLINLNIEGDRHLDRVIPFLKEENADVICLQEVFEKDVKYLEMSVNMRGIFAPVSYVKYKNSAGFTPKNNLGILILTKIKDFKIYSKFYVGTKENIPILIRKNPNLTNRLLLILEFQLDNIEFRIITTHFTWSPNGQVIPLQQDHLERMFQILDSFNDFVLCGDFNAPRGGEIWNKIADKYKDNIPEDITSTIDPNLHKVNNLNYVVDGLFSTPQYVIEDVEVIDQISDHKAIIASIYKTI